MDNNGSLARRAHVAIALTIGFYALALTAAAALLFAAYAQVFWGDEVHVKLVFFCAFTGGLILWSIVPRLDRFVEPGPRLEPEAQPELFAVLRDVAANTRQEMPSEVYLIPEINAYVSHRGGRFGFGSRRVMGLGLTLMESVSVPQFRAVVAHEFGHYANDDLKYGAWIYRTREAIDRTICSLEQHAGFLDAPFKAYGRLFIRVTQAISRAQELAADRLAAAVTSAQDAIAALTVIERVSPAYLTYIEGELAPVLRRGFRPPMGRGFAAFVQVPAVAAALDQALAASMAHGQGDEADTHPPMRERVAALGGDPKATVIDTDSPRAATLLRDLPALEASLVTAMWSDPVAAASFQSVSWEESGARVFVPWWKQNASEHADALRNVTPPRIAEAVSTLVRRTTGGDDERQAFAAHVAGAALAARLHDLGWMCDATPGKPIAFTRDGRTIEPFNVVSKLQKGELSAAAWAEECRAAGLESF
jgi:heat shock protein HtpX